MDSTSANPLVTVVIPCYNYGAFIHHALESLLWQTYTAWECIVVNDGSKDNTEEVVLKYTERDNRIKYIYQNNDGVSGARNRALKEAKGKYVQLLDADDLIERDKLKLQVALLEENPSVDLVFGNMSLFMNEYKERTELIPFLIKSAIPVGIGKEKSIDMLPVSGRGEKLVRGIVEDNFFLPGCTLAKKKLYDEVGLFKKGIEGIEDWHYWYRAALLNKEFYHDTRPGTTLLVRLHGSNASSHTFKMLRGRIRAREDLMAMTESYLHKNDSHLSAGFIKEMLQLHKVFLSRDKSRFHMNYGNIITGIRNNLRYGFYLGKPLYTLYDGAHWIKERIKKGLGAKKAAL